MYKITIRLLRALARIFDQVLKTDLPMDMWLDSAPFEVRR
jgi:hypothetical protein